MRHALAALSAAILLCPMPSPGHAQDTARTNSRAALRNDVGIELGGKAVIYSFSYQRMIVPALGLEAGAGALGGGSSTDNTTLAFFPVSAKLYLFPRNASIYLTGGAVFATAHANTGPFDNASATYGQAGIGFEFRSSSGFLIRGTAYTLVFSGEYLIWPGLTVAYAF